MLNLIKIYLIITINLQGSFLNFRFLKNGNQKYPKYFNDFVLKFQIDLANAVN